MFSITIGLQEIFYLIGYCQLTNIMDLKDHGGSVLAVMKYFILQHYVVNHVVIPSQAIAGSVHHE